MSLPHSPTPAALIQVGPITMEIQGFCNCDSKRVESISKCKGTCFMFPYKPGGIGSIFCLGDEVSEKKNIKEKTKTIKQMWREKQR